MESIFLSSFMDEVNKLGMLPLNLNVAKKGPFMAPGFKKPTMTPPTLLHPEGMKVKERAGIGERPWFGPGS